MDHSPNDGLMIAPVEPMQVDDRRALQRRHQHRERIVAVEPEVSDDDEAQERHLCEHRSVDVERLHKQVFHDLLRAHV